MSRLQPAVPWLPLAEDAQQCNVAAQLADPCSMPTLTCRLLHLRRESRALTIGSYRSLPHVPDECLVYEALNFTNEDQLVRLPEAAMGALCSPHSWTVKRWWISLHCCFEQTKGV